MFNRNKRSLCVDLKSAEGVALAARLVESADVLIENFRPGALAKIGLGPDRFIESNPRLVYYSAKGFLSGPYENRAALDEVAQMMGGLAYMTGPPGRPLRAGASVIDIAGGMFGVIGILAALRRRDQTGLGGEVRSSLYETTAFFVGQHMAQMAVTGVPAQPMPARISAWAIYDVFETADPAEQLFVGVVSDGQWAAFTSEFDLGEIGRNPAYARNNQRVMARDAILPAVRALFVAEQRDRLITRLDRAGIAYAPIVRPEDLFADAHLSAADGLVPVTLEDGTTTCLPALPIEIDGARATLHRDLPRAGGDSRIVLEELGLSAAEIGALIDASIVGVSAASHAA
jgi:crotonobetainyl-CoA:carnitine CoA-transferase CaiB-like acyl-CoA transferase